MSAIHVKYPALTFKAGQRALRQVRERGLQAADVGVLPGAAGGPKPLGIQGLTWLCSVNGCRRRLVSVP